MDGQLTDLEVQVLAFERGRWLNSGARDTAILKTFGLSPVRYQQWVLALIDKPAAYQHDPQLVNRLRRLRDERASRRRAG